MMWNTRFHRILSAALRAALLPCVALCAPGLRAAPLLDAPFVASYAGGPGTFVQTADLDGDARLDLVVASQYPASVRVLRGLGDGRFAAPVIYAPSSGASRPLIADLTGDGKLDLAIADSPNTAVIILPGHGDGTFGTAFVVEIGFQCYTVQAADLDLDGKLDLVASNWASVAVRRGTGGGTFAPVTVYETATNTYRIAIGFLNADAYPDVVTCGDYGSVSVLLGNGDGTLQAATSLGVNSSIGELVVADATGDGHADVVVGVPGTISIFAGDGAGAFAPRTDLTLSDASGRLAVADVNADGHPDLVSASIPPGATYSGAVSVLLGNGSGGFGTRRAFESLPSPQGVAVGDADADGSLDLIVGSGDGNVAIHLGRSDGSFGSIRRYTAGADPVALSLGDLDGDGTLDLVAAHRGSASISIRRGAPNGTFGIRLDAETGPGAPSAVALGDLDRDGHADVVVATAADASGAAQLATFRGFSSGGFAAESHHPFGLRLAGVAVGDLDGDGAPDVVVTDATANRLSVLRNTGSGALLPPVHYGAGDGAWGVALADLNGDSKLDAAVANRGAGTLTLLFGDGTGAFVSELELATATDCRAVAVGLLDGDAIPDLVTANGYDGTLAVLRGLGGGAYAPATLIPVARAPASVSIGLLDGDAVPDLVVGMGFDPAPFGPFDVPTNVVGVLLGTGGGGFQNAQLFGGGTLPQQVAIADLDGNGSTDVVTAARQGNSLQVLLNTRSVLAAVPHTPPAALLLGRSYPSPALSTVNIPFATPREGPASVRIFDAAGRVVRTLAGGALPAGDHLLRWDRRTDSGARAGAGLYFFELLAAERRATGRIVLL